MGGQGARTGAGVHGSREAGRGRPPPLPLPALTTCTRRAAPWPGRRRAPRWGAAAGRRGGGGGGGGASAGAQGQRAPHCQPAQNPPPCPCRPSPPTRAAHLVVDAALEAGGAPVHKLDGALGLDGGDRGVDVLGHHVAAVHEAAGHVLAVAGVALGHHGGGLKGRVGDLRHRQLLVVGLLGGDDGGVGGEHEVDARVGHQVGLELGDVHVQRAVKAQGGGERGDDLREGGGA